MKPIVAFATLQVFAAFVVFPRSCWSFEISKVFSRITSSFPPPSTTNTNTLFSNNNRRQIETAKNELLQTISSTNNGKDSTVETQIRVLSLVDYLETNQPVSDSLFTNPIEAEAIDGVWFLKYTQPSSIDDIDTADADVDVDKIQPWTPEESTLDVTNKLDTRKAKNAGSVSFLTYVKVDTSNKLTTQTIGVKDNIFANAVKQNFGTIEVKGKFELDSVPNRIIAAFDTGTLTLNNGFVINFSILFALRSMLKGGMKAMGWLETTYLDNDIRIGRGNRGSLFILTRDNTIVL
ncbi:MAG: hypothetical protein ACI8RD_000120 [Bacillariaceae sp.]|jgi:hypothetical protein